MLSTLFGDFMRTFNGRDMTNGPESGKATPALASLDRCRAILADDVTKGQQWSHELLCTLLTGNSNKSQFNARLLYANPRMVEVRTTGTHQPHTTTAVLRVGQYCWCAYELEQRRYHGRRHGRVRQRNRSTLYCVAHFSSVH